MKYLLIPMFILVLLFSGCLGSQTQAETINDTDKAQNEQIAALREGLTKVPSVSQYNDLTNKVSALETDKSSNGYSEDEVDKLISEIRSKIDSLQLELALLKAKLDSGTGGGTGTGTGSQTNQVTMKIYNAPTNLIYDSGSYTWWLEIYNGYVDYKKVFVNGVFSFEGTHNGDVTVWNSDVVSPTGTYIHSPELITGGNSSGVFSMLFNPSDNTTSTDCTLYSGTSQGYKVLQGLQKVVIPVTLTLNYSTTDRTKWIPSWSITPTSYP